MRIVLVLVSLLAIRPIAAQAAFHFAWIDEVAFGVGGDPTAQYVEIRMLSVGQNLVQNSVLAIFNCDGSMVADLLIVPDDVPNGANGARWSMGTASLAAATGVTPDFTFAPASAAFLPCGMVCWGAPGSGQPPDDPNSWARTDRNNFVDCVAFGGYTGALQSGQTSPETLGPGDGATMSLQRTGDTGSDLADFALAPLTATNNTGGGPGTTTTTGTTTPGTTTTSTTFPPEVGQKVSGKKLLLKRKGLNVISKDPTISLGDGNGSTDDPTIHGGSVRVVSTPGGFDTTYQLPAGSWRRIGKSGQNRGYKLKPSAVIRSLVIKPGKLVKVVGKGAVGHTLLTSPDPVGVAVAIGAERYCLAFPGGTFTAGKKYLAKDAPAPAACAP